MLRRRSGAWRLQWLGGSSQQPSDSLGHPLHLVLGERHTARQIETLAVEPLGHRVALTGEQSSRPQHRLLMHGAEEWTAANARGSQAPHGFGAIQTRPFVEHQAIDPVDILGVVGIRQRQLYGLEAAEQLRVVPADEALVRDELIETLELGN